MNAYYNEWDTFAAAWTRELMKDGLIAQGEVDETDIQDVVPVRLSGYRQWHLFAGISCWSAALRMAGWTDNREVLTVSCPCQPFSSAGKRAGTSDERHLWPAAFHIISQLRPAVVFGEQVASKDGLAWFDLVSADLEAAGYTVGAAVTTACGFGAPHIRQRLYFVGVALGNADDTRSQGRGGVSERAAECLAWPAGLAEQLADTSEQGSGGRRVQRPGQGDGESAGAARERLTGLRADGRLDNSAGPRLNGQECDPEGLARDEARLRLSGAGCTTQRLGNPCCAASERHTGSLLAPEEGEHGAGVAADGAVPERLEHASPGVPARPGPTNGLWSRADWLFCRDAKWRPVIASALLVANAWASGAALAEGGGKGGTEAQALLDSHPLAEAGTYRNRVAELKGAGNALCIGQAAGFISAVMEALDA